MNPLNLKLTRFYKALLEIRYEDFGKAMEIVELEVRRRKINEGLEPQKGKRKDDKIVP